MKKTLMTLSILALLTGCTSADKEKERMDALETRLEAVEMSSAETMDMLSDTKIAMMDAEKEVAMAERKTQAMSTFINPESVFIEDGIEIVEKEGVPTLIMQSAVTFDLNSADVKPEF